MEQSFDRLQDAIRVKFPQFKRIFVEAKWLSVGPHERPTSSGEDRLSLGSCTVALLPSSPSS